MPCKHVNQGEISPLTTKLLDIIGKYTYTICQGDATVPLGVDRVCDFALGEDKLVIVNGSASLVSFVDEGANLGVYYDGVKIAVLMGVGAIPVDTNVFFAP